MQSKRNRLPLLVAARSKQPSELSGYLSEKGYGIRGTPDPEAIGKGASHGCIRLTNWDALELAKHVQKGTSVKIEGGRIP